MDAAEVERVRAETPGLNAAGKLSGAYLNNAGAALMPAVVVRLANRAGGRQYAPERHTRTH